MKPALLIPIFFLLFAIPVRAEVTREQIKEVGKELSASTAASLGSVLAAPA